MYVKQRYVKYQKFDYFCVQNKTLSSMTTLYHIGQPNIQKNSTLPGDLTDLTDFTVESGCNPYTGEGLAHIIQSANQPFFLVCTSPRIPVLGPHAIDRMIRVATDTGAGMLYADYLESTDGTITAHPLNDYQEGSLRDDFDFGPLLLLRTEAAKHVLETLTPSLQAAALYELRLAVTRHWPIVHLDERLYTLNTSSSTDSETKQFAYVDPKNRTAQLEMETVCTKHLKAVGAWLPPEWENIDLKTDTFPVEASVIIPVRNRKRTITDAVKSVLKQQTTFPFNVIVIDNHSTDGTTEMLAELALNDTHIVHLIPGRNDLGIGGCWNAGVHHASCGRFAVQLDSDDMYSDEHVLERIVQEFYKQRCAMLIGSYRMCDFDLNTLPPGIIDHREWTEANGRNNALRVNGLGAPRAFFTPLLRSINLPNTSYGEDYAIGLRLSRQWRIGRIYDVLYLCRRWEENSDASIDLIKSNQFNHYKDKLRTIELKARQQLNPSKS